MKRTPVLAVCLGVLSAAILAQEPRPPISPAPDDNIARKVKWHSGSGTASIGLSVRTALEPAPDMGGTIADLVQARKSEGLHTESVIEESYSFALILPVAINSPGKNGTYFRTDATICNYRSTDQTIAVGWMPNGVSGAGGGITYYTLKARTIYMVRDFLGSGSGSWLKLTGVGAVMISGMYTGTSTVDSDAMLDASFRIWTYEPGSRGTTSFGVGASLGTVYGMWTADAIGLRHDAGFRTNVGIVNMDGSSHSWSVRIVGDLETTFTVTVPPLALMQVPVPDLSYGDIFIDFTPIDFTSSSVYWNAYGVTADDVTGDAWLSRASQ